MTNTESGNREVYDLQGLIGNMVGSEVVLGAAALAFAHSRLGKLMPALTIPPRPLANSLAQVKAGAKVLTLEYTGTTEVPWSCPLLRDLAWVEPAVTRHLAVDIPLAVGAKGEIRAFRPFAYLEKLLLQLEAARLKVRSTQPFDLLDMWTLLKSLSAHCSLRPGSLSLNCLSFVLPTQSDYTRIYIYPASPPSISPSIDLKTGSGLVLSPQQIVLDSRLGPIFAVDSKGNIATPRLSTESGQWTGVRPNIMRDSLLVVYSVEARSCSERS